MEGVAGFDFGAARDKRVNNDLLRSKRMNVIKKKRVSRSKMSYSRSSLQPVTDQVSLVSPTVTGIPRLQFLFQKELQSSDVNNSLRRIVVPKGAEVYLPKLYDREGIIINMDDMDGKHKWSFRFRYWPNNSSRMYIFENMGNFVMTHGLEEGDFILVYYDIINRNYVIGASKVCETTLSRSENNSVESENSAGENSKHSPYVYETTLTYDRFNPFDFDNTPGLTYKSKMDPMAKFMSIEELLRSFNFK